MSIEFGLPGEWDEFEKEYPVFVKNLPALNATVKSH
jgi:hypothetical protein